jgi:protein-disulfide isomerase
VPVSLLAILLYVGVLLATFYLPTQQPPLPESAPGPLPASQRPKVAKGHRKEKAVQKEHAAKQEPASVSMALAPRRFGCWHFLIFAAVVLVSAAVWFISLQLFVIKAICPFCMTAHACGLALGIQLLAKATYPARSPESAGPGRPSGLVPMPAAIRLGLAGLAAVIVLSTAQVVYHPNTYAVQPMATPLLLTSNLAAKNRSTTALEPSVSLTQRTAAPVPLKPPPPHRFIQLADGGFTLDLNDVPLHGSPDAPNVMVHLFDYSCHHCRQLHPVLMETLERLSNQLAIVSLPLPLDSNCNPVIKIPIPDHTNACAYARLGLAVWRANPEKLEAFDDWIFAPPRPPSPEEVRAQAVRLVGTNALTTALSDPWIERELRLGMQLYETNYARYRRSALPELIVGKVIVSGVVPNAAQLYQLLTNHFSVR